MKYNLKKVATVFASALMLGSTAGLALAANYPAPFVSNGSSDVAVVVGSGNGVNDAAAALDVAEDLSAALVGQVGSGNTVVTGGDSFKLEKSSDKFYLSDALNSSYTSLDSDELESFLADGTYDDGDIDTDYEQSITLGSKALSLFADKDFDNDEPTVGFWFTNGQNILSYTIEFDDSVNTTKMVETNIPLLNNDYYVLSATTTKVTLLDSADSVILSDGDEATVGDKTVTIEYVSDTKVKFNVDGEVTDTMEEGDNEELSDGSYIVVTDILYAEKEAGVSKVEFAIGSGKIILSNGNDVRIGEDDSDSEVDGLVATISSPGAQLIDSISLAWNSDDDTFVTEGNPAVMPGFDALSLAFNGLSYADEAESISFDNGETLVLNMGNYDIPLMWYDGTSYAQGEENYVLSIASPSAYTYAQAGYANASTMFWGGASQNNSSTISTGLALDEDNTFIVTRIDQDLGDVETLYYQVKEIDVDDGEVSVTLEDLIGSDDITFEDVDETEDQGDVSVTLGAIDAANNTVYLEFSASSGSLSYNNAVSDKGLVVTIPAAAEGASISFREADKDEDVNEGEIFSVTVANSTNDKLYVSLPSQGNVSKEETKTDDVYTAIVNSDLATTISTDESDDEYTIEISYYGSEAVADVQVIGGGQATESDDPASVGIATITDAEAAASTKNLIVIGGSAVNSFAASLLDVSAGTSEDAFTAASGVKSGEALIKSYARNGGKVAVLIAGYEKLDTERAVTYALNNDWDSSNVNVKLATATSATSVIA